MKWLKVFVPGVCNAAGFCLGAAVLALVWCLMQSIIGLIVWTTVTVLKIVPSYDIISECICTVSCIRFILVPYCLVIGSGCFDCSIRYNRSGWSVIKDWAIFWIISFMWIFLEVVHSIPGSFGLCWGYCWLVIIPYCLLKACLLGKLKADNVLRLKGRTMHRESLRLCSNRCWVAHVDGTLQRLLCFVLLLMFFCSFKRGGGNDYLMKALMKAAWICLMYPPWLCLSNVMWSTIYCPQLVWMMMLIFPKYLSMAVVSVCYPWMIMLILLSGDIELNPGPAKTNPQECMMNMFAEITKRKDAIGLKWEDFADVREQFFPGYHKYLWNLYSRAKKVNNDSIDILKQHCLKITQIRLDDLLPHCWSYIGFFTSNLIASVFERICQC